jgi:hypothetical protein
VCVCSMEEAMVSFINKLAWFLRFPSTTCDALLALAPHRTKHAYVIALWLCRGVFLNHKPMTCLLEVTTDFCLYCDSWYRMTVFTGDGLGRIYCNIAIDEAS